MKALAIVRVNLLRLLRDRVAVFFVFVFPVILILMLGAAFGGGFRPKLGVVDSDPGPYTRDLVRDIAGDSVDVIAYDDTATLESAVERGLVEGGLVVPADHDERLRVGDAEVHFIAQPDDVAGALRTEVEAAVGRQAALAGAARAVAREVGSFDRAAEVASRVRLLAPVVDVDVEGGPERDVTGRFDIGAATQLVLFTFVNSLAGSVALIQTRSFGVSRRMLGTPTTARTVVVGETAGRFAVALLQGLFIIGAAAILFGVRWGDPVAAAALIVVFALVSTGAATLAGSWLSNEQQAGALTPLGLALAALGGCMVPLEVFSPAMRTIAHVTPHAWAVEGFTKVMRTGAGVTEVLPQLGALLAFAAVLLAAASLRLRRAVLS